jgi:hypothetical protein
MDYWLHYVTEADRGKSTEDSTKIHYITHRSLPNVIFLGVKVSDISGEALESQFVNNNLAVA